MRFWWIIFRKSEGKRRTEEETWPRHDMRFKTCWQKIYVSERDKRIFSSDRVSSSDENLTPFYRTLQLLLHALFNKNAFYVIGSSLTFLRPYTTFFLWFMNCKRNKTPLLSHASLSSLALHIKIINDKQLNMNHTSKRVTHFSVIFSVIKSPRSDAIFY